MSDFYVPINYSDVSSVIPQGEDIIYSTLCNAKVDRGFGYAYVDVTTWVTHVLITTKGLAFTIPQRNKSNKLLYIPWYDVHHTWNDAILLGGFKQRLAVTRDPNFESKEKFKERRLKAGKIFLPILIKEKETFLNSPESSNIKNIKRNRMKSSLNRNYKLYHKLKEKGMLELSHGIILAKISSFLRDNKGKAFTFKALNNRIEEIFEDPNEKEYCKKNLQDILNELISIWSITSVQHGDVTHYTTA